MKLSLELINDVLKQTFYDACKRGSSKKAKSKSAQTEKTFFSLWVKPKIAGLRKKQSRIC